MTMTTDSSFADNVDRNNAVHDLSKSNKKIASKNFTHAQSVPLRFLGYIPSITQSASEPAEQESTDTLDCESIAEMTGRGIRPPIN